jgi:hypothetical protein
MQVLIGIRGKLASVADFDPNHLLLFVELLG